MGVNDTYWMQQALSLALLAQQNGEVPVGALVVAGDTLLGEGYNQVLGKHDPTAHAEIIAIRQAALSVGNYRLDKATLYVTLEPCSMCAGAMVHARIGRLVFAARDFQAGAAGSRYNLLRGYPLNHKIIIDEGVLEADCSHLLKDFFQSRR